MKQHYKESRPWGTYEILHDGDDCKVKKITVKPRQNPSYQYHFKRNEHWVIISGIGCAKLDGKKVEVTAGSIVHVPIECKHTIANTHDAQDLVFIEIQTGTYFGEDDIVRLEDNYGRI